MSKNHEHSLEAVLEPGERLLWSGAPDQAVMKKTLGKRKSSVFNLVFFILVLGAIALGLRDQLPGIGQLNVTGLAISSNMIVTVFVAIAFIAVIVFLKRWQTSAHVDNLAYGITDQRVLIVRKGKIMVSRKPSEIQWLELQERRGAKGFSDIIWEVQRASSSTDSTPSPLQRERARIGFKALPDGAAVMDRLERWRNRHKQAAQEITRAATQALQDGAPMERLRHPRMGFSIAIPPGWKQEVRVKKVVFGKTGVDMTADKWYAPERDDDWNVIRLTGPDNAEVIVEVAKSPPLAKYDDMANPKMPGFMKKVVKVVDSERHVSINGLQGFSVDQELSGMGDSKMALGQSSRRLQRLLRQLVLHDDAHQYYLIAAWSLGDEVQQAACEALLASFEGCSGLVA